jgi:hypothetical protein
LVRILEPKANDVAILQFAAFDLAAVYEKPAALSAILNVELVGFRDDCRAGAGDAAIRELQVISRFGAAADEKRELRYTEKTTPAVRGDDFQNGFRGNGANVRHVGQPITQL